MPTHSLGHTLNKKQPWRGDREQQPGWLSCVGPRDRSSTKRDREQPSPSAVQIARGAVGLSPISSHHTLTCSVEFCTTLDPKTAPGTVYTPGHQKEPKACAGLCSGGLSPAPHSTGSEQGQPLLPWGHPLKDAEVRCGEHCPQQELLPKLSVRQGFELYPCNLAQRSLDGPI